MALSKSQWIGIISAAVIIAVSGGLLYMKLWVDLKTFYFVTGIAVVIGGLPFFLSLLVESRREKSIDTMFLEFSRDLVEGVRAGTPISKSIMNVRTKNYGSLDPHVDKLANQIGLGIPVKDALDTFARDIKSPVISRAISLIREAEIAGGKIESILESVSFSVSQIEKLKKERQAAIYNLAVQGYIIFLIFIAIMLIMEFKILPITSGLGIGGLGGADMGDIGLGGTLGSVSGTTPQITPESFSKPFLLLLITQGFFAGLIIGKISEGTVKAGLKHSFILVAISWLVATGANLVLG
jgi:flagellar protein FlaJ